MISWFLEQKERESQHNYTQELENLEQRGYEDRQQNMEKLEMYDGDVNLVISDYEITDRQNLSTLSSEKVGSTDVNTQIQSKKQFQSTKQKSKKTQKKQHGNINEQEEKLDTNEVRETDWVRGVLIGEGAHGKVYKGHDKNTGKTIAIKQIPFNFGAFQDSTKQINIQKNNKTNQSKSKSKNNKKQNQLIIAKCKTQRLLEKEASIMSELKHENIVSFLGFTRNIKENRLCILMEYVPGKSIDTIYKNSPMTESTIKRYTKQLLSALQYAHCKNIIHRDIKGNNILVDNKGNIKLADFGSAKLVTDFTNTGNIKLQTSSCNFTPLWTAPELIKGNYNEKVDLWSIGCVIIEMATAKLPWNELISDPNFNSNHWGLLYHIGNTKHVPKWPKSLSKSCDNFLTKCLTRDSKSRWSATQLLRHKFLQ